MCCAHQVGLARSHSYNKSAPSSSWKYQHLLCTMYLISLYAWNGHGAHGHFASHRKGSNHYFRKGKFSVMKCNQRYWHWMCSTILQYFTMNNISVRTSTKRTIAAKSPRFGPLTSQSRTISSTSYRKIYRRSLSPELDPQWKDVRIVRVADIGWPA